MCGIVGYYGKFDRRSLVPALNAIAHRGPDDSGIFMDKAARVGLAHARLSILDLSPLGHQPMVSGDGKVVLVFNGEIYNFRQLRKELEAKGIHFRGQSDTEVLLNLYLLEGEAMLPRLNGIFAIALWDGRSQSLLVARDALGVKPLYIAELPRGFVFASEIKALKHLLPETLELDPLALHRYLSFLWCPGEGTPFKAVRKLLPGEAMVVRDGRITRRWTWYQLPLFRGIKADLGEAEALEGTVSHLRQAVERQMVADVPVGAFLSGGLDSSAVVTFARELNPDIHCFTIEATGGRSDGATDDLPYARKVAKHLNVPLEVVRIDAEQMAHDLERMVFQMDEPLADPAPLNVLYISQLARSRGIKVLLSGVGGDDLFSGYRRHLAVQLEHYWNWMPLGLRSGLERITAGLDQRQLWSRRLTKFFNGAGLDMDARLANYFIWSCEADLLALYTHEFRAQLGDVHAVTPLIDFLRPASSSASTLERMLTLDQRFFLADHNLIYTDKMSMAAGVEVRVPFLDIDLVDYAARIPVKLKQHGRVGKWVLKKAMEPYLPHDIIYRPKTGFGAPLRRWMRNELRPLLGDLLSAEGLKKNGIFDANAVQQLIRNNDAGKVDAAYTLLSILTIEIWCRAFSKGSMAVEGTNTIGVVTSVVTHSATNSGNARSVAQSMYQICTNCVMDTSDSKITFDDKGMCDHCNTFYHKVLPGWHTDERGQHDLQKLVNKIKQAGKGKDFDCIIGVSGGVDSSYLTYIAKEQLGLHPLVFHVDAGWNSQVAVNNIEKLIDKLGLDLYTEVIDWDEMRDLQLAFFKSGVPHIDTPQDHAFFATMYKFAEQHKVKYILTGANLSTECIRNPVEWMYYQSDSIQLRDIHRRFGTRPLVNFPVTSILHHKIYLPYIKSIKVVRPLNYIPYIKQQAIDLLVGKFGWQPYPQKHFESRFTKFYEGYWLPKKFGYDTRRVQFSSLIVTNQMTREDAMKMLEHPPFDEAVISQEFEYVATKLGISVEELQGYMDAPNKTYKDYKSQESIYSLGAKVMKRFGLELGGKR